MFQTGGANFPLNGDTINRRDRQSFAVSKSTADPRSPIGDCDEAGHSEGNGRGKRRRRAEKPSGQLGKTIADALDEFDRPAGKTRFSREMRGGETVTKQVRHEGESSTQKMKKRRHSLKNTAALSLLFGRPYHSRPNRIVPNYSGRSNSKSFKRATNAAGSSTCPPSARVA